MPWQLTTLFFVILSSLRSIQNRRIGLYKIDLTLYTLVAAFVCVSTTGIVIAIANWSRVDIESAKDAWAFLMLGGLLFGALNYLTIKLYRYLVASVAVFLSLMNTVSVVLFASLISGESLTSRQWIGSLLLLFAVVTSGLLASQKTTKATRKIVLIGIFTSVLIALLFGPAIVNEKYLIDRIGLETYLLFGWGSQAIATFIIAFLLKKRTKNSKMTLAMHINVWFYGVLLAVSGMFFVISLKNSGSSSLVTISGTAKIALTVFLAYIILKERKFVGLKTAAVILSSIGLYLLFT